jgi:prefoldin subunit 5
MTGLSSPDIAKAAILPKSELTAGSDSHVLRTEVEARASASTTPAEAFVDAAKSRDIPNAEVTGAIINNNFGTERDITSGAKFRDETAEPGAMTRHDDTEKAAASISEYLKNPTDVPSAEVIAWADKILSLGPSAGALPDNSTPAGAAARAETIKKILQQNPDLTDAIRNQFISTFAEGSNLPDEVTAAKLQEQKLIDKYEALRETKGKKGTDLRTKQNHQDEFDHPTEPSHDDPSKPGVGKELEDLNAKIEELRRTKGDAAAEATALEKKKRTLMSEKASLSGDAATKKQEEIDVINGRLTAVKASGDEAAKDIARQEELSREKANLSNDMAKLTTEIADLDREMNQTQTERLMAAATREQKQIARRQAEQAFADKVDGVVGRGVIEWATTKLEEAQKIEANMRQKKIDEAKTAAEKAVAEQEMYRYVDKDGKPNRIPIEKDWKIYKDKTKGAREVLRGMLTDQLAKDNKLNPRHPVDKAKLDILVNERMSDQVFVDAQLDGVVESLIAARLRSGEKLTDGEGYYILSNPATEGAIDAAILRNDKLKQKMDELKASGKMERGIMEFLKSQSGPNMLKWLLFIFGTAGVGGILLANQLS